MLLIAFESIDGGVPPEPSYLVPGDNLVFDMLHQDNMFARYVAVADPSGLKAYLYGYTVGDVKASADDRRVKLETLIPESVMEPHRLIEDDGCELNMWMSLRPFPVMELIECPMCGLEIHPFRMLAHTDGHRAVDVIGTCLTFANFYDWLHDALQKLIDAAEEDWEVESCYPWFSEELMRQAALRRDMTEWLMRQHSADTDVPSFHRLKPPPDNQWRSDLLT